jgi:hypothetical protein
LDQVIQGLFVGHIEWSLEEGENRFHREMKKGYGRFNGVAVLR